MALPLVCSCGQKLQARDEWAGRKVQCPKCATFLTVPPLLDEQFSKAPASFDVIEPGAIQSGTPGPSSEAAPRPDLDDDDTEYDRRVRRAKREARTSRLFTGSSGEILGGILMIAGGIVWFGLGVGAGIIFYKPIFLVIGGIIATTKGFIDRE